MAGPRWFASYESNAVLLRCVLIRVSYSRCVCRRLQSWQDTESTCLNSDGSSYSTVDSTVDGTELWVFNVRVNGLCVRVFSVPVIYLSGNRYLMIHNSV